MSERHLGDDERGEEEGEIGDVERAGGEAEALRDLVTEDDDHAESDDRQRRVREERAEREGVSDVGGRAPEPRRQVNVSVDSVTKRSREMRESMEARPFQPAEDGGIGRTSKIEEAPGEQRDRSARSREPDACHDACHAPSTATGWASFPRPEFAKTSACPRRSSGSARSTASSMVVAPARR
jgi:hypothetical protein